MSDFTKSFNLIMNEINKAAANRGHLVRKQIVDKNGHRKTVYVRPDESINTKQKIAPGVKIELTESVYDGFNEDEYDLSEKEIEDRKKLFESVLTQPNLKAVKFDYEDGIYYILHKSSRVNENGKKWQLSKFDSKGPYGHFNTDDPMELIRPELSQLDLFRKGTMEFVLEEKSDDIRKSIHGKRFYHTWEEWV